LEYVRPGVGAALLDSLSNDSVSIVSRIGDMDLLKESGRPNSKLASDHLPTVCELSEIQETANVIEESVG
jgi:hypothetical protein